MGDGRPAYEVHLDTSRDTQDEQEKFIKSLEAQGFLEVKCLRLIRPGLLLFQGSITAAGLKALADS